MRRLWKQFVWLTLLPALLLPAADSFAADRIVAYVSLAGENAIRTFELSADGRLKPLATFQCNGDPGASVVHRTGRFLYVALRSADSIAALEIDPQDASLRLLDSVDVLDSPSWLTVDASGQWLLSAYYRAGKISVHQIRDDGTLQPWPTHSVSTDRNAHSVVLHPSNQFLIVPHTGPNAIWQFRFRPRTGLLRPADPLVIHTGPGTGPRHAAFHPTLDVAYVDNEQGSSVTQFRVDTKRASLTAMRTLPSIPPGYTGRNSCARLRLTVDGRMLFVSNRGHDSIAAFRVDPLDGSLVPAGVHATVATPRGFDIDPAGKLLIAAGQTSGSVATYRIGDENAEVPLLQPVQTLAIGKRPWWITIAGLTTN